MNPPPSLPYTQNPIPDFSYQPPYQNPDPNFFFQPPPPNPNQCFVAPPPPPPPPPVRELSGTFASLKSLVSLCQQTLDSLSQTLAVDPLPLLRKDENGGFVRCPFDPKHLMPPEALFLHSIRCPPPLDLTHHLGSLSYYRNSLEPPSELELERSGGDLCFSLDDHCDFGSSFFYKDCPSVVNLSEIDRKKRTLVLPCVLSVECDDFVGFDEKEKECMLERCFGVLPSDLWATRSEIDAWRDYPTSYSFSVLCAVLGSKMVGKSELRKWIIANSPRYGVIIDTHMRDHIFSLVQLCLKAIVREACGLVEFDGNAEDLKENEQIMSLKSRRFECPVLFQVLPWLASQLAVLYGEGSGKFFALDIFKQCILESASRIMLFQCEGNTIETPKPKSTEVHEVDGTSVNGEDVKLEEPFDNNSEGKPGKSSVSDQAISVSRVAAAVAALHERSLFEGKIRATRFSQPLTRYQRMAEHDVMTKKADEERKKRPSYRPIIEHDGLPRHRSSNQEINKIKTREELIAEERDYKRRRMSYRGKKVKRTPLQVLRDIIEQYTEEIRLAGGIGCFEKGHEEETTSQFPSSAGDGGKKVDFDNNTASTISDSASPRFYKQSKGDYHTDNEFSAEGRTSTDKEKLYKGYDSGSSRRKQSHGSRRSYEHGDHREEEFTRTRHHSIQRKSYNQPHRSSSHAKGSSNYRNKRKDDYDGSSWGSWKQYAFEDRYNPSEQE